MPISTCTTLAVFFLSYDIQFNGLYSSRYVDTREAQRHDVNGRD